MSHKGHTPPQPQGKYNRHKIAKGQEGKGKAKGQEGVGRAPVTEMGKAQSWGRHKGATSPPGRGQGQGQGQGTRLVGMPV